MNNQSQQSRKRERGQTTAEFVMVFPFLILLFFLMVDFGWLFKNYLVVTNTGREVARCAVVSSCKDSSGDDVGPVALATDRINAGLFGNIGTTTVTVEFIDIASPTGLSKGDSILVCIEAENEYISPVMPFLSMVTGGSDALPDPLPLRSRTEMRAENVPSSWEFYDDIVESADGSCSFS